MGGLPRFTLQTGIGSSIMRHLLASGEAGEIEARLRRYDGNIDVLVPSGAVRDNHGNIVKWCGANTDIEDRKRAEALLAAENGLGNDCQRGSLTAILESLCETIDGQTRNIKSAVMLMDAIACTFGTLRTPSLPLGTAPLPRAPLESQGWIDAITPVKIACYRFV